MFLKSSEKIICRFCKLGHRVYTKKEVSIFDILFIFTITAVMAVAIWGGPDLRSLLIFMSLAFTMQVFLRVRYRESLKCPHCGFDPMVYKRDPSQAAQAVKEFLERRKDNPEFLLKPKPKIKPIYLNKNEIQMLKDSEALQEAEVSAALPANETPAPGRSQASLPN